MVQLYRQEYAEIILFYFLLFSLAMFSLYVNALTVSLSVLGPDWDIELIVIGTSMSPKLQYGDSICIDVGNSSTLTIVPNVTIIVFQEPYLTNMSSEEDFTEIFSHRVIAIARNNGDVYFKTQGDGNLTPDYWVDIRGEEYTWNGMISDKLLVGKVIGVRKANTTWEPLLVMTTVVTSITILSFIIVVGSREPEEKTEKNQPR